MSKMYEEMRKARLMKREQKARMFKVKVNVMLTENVSRFGIEDKAYYRDEAMANEAAEKLRTALSDAISGKVQLLTLGDTVIKSENIAGYSVKIRKPKIDPELPITLDDDDDDDD